MRFVTNRNLGILGYPDSTELWTNIINHIPDSVLLNTNVKILSIACGHCTETDVIVKRLKALNVSSVDIKNRIYVLDKYRIFTNYAKLKGYTNIITCDFLEWETTMKFDVIVGNPPYQDGTKTGGQNKIYNQFCKRAIELLNSNGILAFITPSAVCKKSKRFSLIGQPGLKIIDFTTNDYFEVGTKICSWIIDKTYNGKITVKNKNRTDMLEIGSLIHDYSSLTDISIFSIYDAIMQKTSGHSNYNNRMFKRNNHGPAFSNIKTDKHIYEIHSNSKGINNIVYSRREPVAYKKLKLIISNTKALNEDNIIISKNDYGPSYFVYPIESNDDIINIKSFILSQYFIDLAKHFRNIRGGMNSVLIDYCPVFDKNKRWTNKEVQEFFESFNS